LRVDLDRRRGVARPTFGKHVRGIADQMRRTEARGLKRFRDRRHLGLGQRAAIASDHLKIDMVVARIDRGDDHVLAVFADRRGSVSPKRGHSDHRLRGRKGNAACRR
jgi:hypothetical protein